MATSTLFYLNVLKFASKSLSLNLLRMLLFLCTLSKPNNLPLKQPNSPGPKTSFLGTGPWGLSMKIIYVWVAGKKLYTGEGTMIQYRSLHFSWLCMLLIPKGINCEQSNQLGLSHRFLESKCCLGLASILKKHKSESYYLWDKVIKTACGDFFFLIGLLLVLSPHLLRRIRDLSDFFGFCMHVIFLFLVFPDQLVSLLFSVSGLSRVAYICSMNVKSCSSDTRPSPFPSLPHTYMPMH